MSTGVLRNGVSARQANRAWERDITIPSGTVRTLDLYDFEDIGAGANRDGLGLAITVEEIVCLIIKHTGGIGRLEINPTSVASDINWIPAGYATVANGGALKSGGVHMWYQDDTDALDITDATSHTLRLGANGGTVTASVHVLGRHDDDESSSSTS